MIDSCRLYIVDVNLRKHNTRYISRVVLSFVRISCMMRANLIFIRRGCIYVWTQLLDRSFDFAELYRIFYSTQLLLLFYGYIPHLLRFHGIIRHLNFFVRYIVGVGKIKSKFAVLSDVYVFFSSLFF